MDNAVAEKFSSDFGLTQAQINEYETYFNRTLLPAITRHYLSHLVTTIEEIINEKEKQEFLEFIKTANDRENAGFDYVKLEKTINRKILRLFSIILAPVDSGKLKARTYFLKEGYGVLITYWKELPAEQIRFLIAHELGHVANKYLFRKTDLTSGDGLASLFGYIALQNRSHFYKHETKPFIRDFDLQIYDDIANICHRKDM